MTNLAKGICVFPDYRQARAWERANERTRPFPGLRDDTVKLGQTLRGKPMNAPASQLYEADFAAWALRNAQLLREGRIAEADLENISEELESLARKDRNELISHLVILLLHLLKYQYQKQRRNRGWRNSIVEQRYQVQRQLKLSPSLKPFLPTAMEEAYPDAVKLAVQETGLDKSVFPSEGPYTIEDVLREDFFGEVE